MQQVTDGCQRTAPHAYGKRVEEATDQAFGRTVVAPSKVAPEVPLPEVIETVTLGLVEVTRLPSKSVTRTTGWEATGLPALELDG